jgi:hypothetical protein
MFPFEAILVTLATPAHPMNETTNGKLHNTIRREGIAGPKGKLFLSAMLACS